jgi:hypothetical protein
MRTNNNKDPEGSGIKEPEESTNDNNTEEININIESNNPENNNPENDTENNSDEDDDDTFERLFLYGFIIGLTRALRRYRDIIN